MLCYPGHLSHILQGPDVVLNKPLSTEVEHLVFNNPLVSGNSDLSRVSVIAIICHAVETVCTVDNMKMAFDATGIVPFNPARIDLSSFPSSSAGADRMVSTDSPAKATCSTCRVNNVELHPLVRQGIVPKHLADCFNYTPPPTKTKTKSKVVQKGRVITSEEVKAEVRAIEEKKKAKLLKVKFPMKAKSRKQKKGEGKRILKRMIREEREKMTDEDDEDDEEIESDEEVQGEDEVSEGESESQELEEEEEKDEDPESDKELEEEDSEQPEKSKLKKGDCVKIIHGSFLGYYAMVIEHSYGDEFKVQYFQKNLGKYVLKPNDFDSSEESDLGKVEFELNARSRYTFE